MSVLPLTRLFLIERGRRIAALIGFAFIFLVSGVSARVLTTAEGHVEVGELFLLGGYPAVSAIMLLGWLLGRYPLIATLVLFAGFFSADRAAGYARLYATRPVSFVRLYGLRFLALAAVAALLSLALLPGFDYVMLGQWAGYPLLIVIVCYIAVYSALTVFLSLFTRGEAWIALALGLTAMIWDALRRGGILERAPAGVREAVSFLLPPQGPLFRIEGAFGDVQPIPWIDVAYVLGYAFVLLLATGILIGEREV